jgi:hypothetical protein
MVQGGGKQRGVISRVFALCRRSHRVGIESHQLDALPGQKGSAVMDDLLELDTQVLTSDIPDEVLERAATAEQQAVTWVYCTNAWHYCDWPQ